MCLCDCDLPYKAGGVVGISSVINQSCLFVAGSEVPLDICERIIAKSKTVSRMLLSHVQLDPVTLSSLVARNVITNGKAVLLRNTSDTPDERVFNILRPALLSGGKVSLQAFYRTLLETKEGRLGHVALAEAIKKKGEMHLGINADHVVWRWLLH